MVNVQGTLLSGAATVLIIVFYLVTIVRVGMMRGKHGVKAPACTGHPEFERAYRVQMNTLEQMAVVLPLLWVANLFPWVPVIVAPLLAVLWVGTRVIYMQTYMTDPDKRGLGAGSGMLCALLLLVLAIGGIVRVWLILG